MKRFKLPKWLIIVIILFVMAFCGLLSNLSKRPAKDSGQTLDPVAATISAMDTDVARSFTPTSQLTSTPEPTVLPSHTPEPTKTQISQVESSQTAIIITQDYRVQFKQIDTRELVSYTDNHAFEAVYFPCKVFKVNNDRDYQCFVNGFDPVFVTSEYAYSGLYEDDQITVFGTIKGTKCGTNSLGGQVCMPHVIEAFFER